MDDFDPADFEVIDGVKECHRIVSPYKLASRHLQARTARSVKIGNVEIGGTQVVVDGRAVQRRDAKTRLSVRRRSWRRRARRSCAAARSSRALRPTVSRDWAKKV